MPNDKTQVHPEVKKQHEEHAKKFHDSLVASGMIKYCHCCDEIAAHIDQKGKPVCYKHYVFELNRL